MPTGQTLIFFDFLSISQRAFAEGQPDRTPEMQAAFGAALKAMPWIYLFADAVLHVDMEWAPVPGDGEVISAKCSELDGLELLQLGPMIQVSGRRPGAEGSVRTFDIVVEVIGKSVKTIEELRSEGRG